MQREPVATYGSFIVYLERPTAMRSYPRFTVWMRGKYIGAYYSFPTADDCRRLTIKPVEPEDVFLKDLRQTVRQYPTTTHRTAATNKAAKERALKSA